ncbi:MAG: hypothetical protein CMJ75_05710 [Planctomycetaceae bacterium]|nr:hypothetical protein [Planctomycetaceae bacterium]
MRQKLRIEADAPGQDAFLDIVANLVGILIILVMIVGARAKDAMNERPATTPPTATTAAEDDGIQILEDTAAGLETDIHKTQSKINLQEQEIAYRRIERDQLLTLLTATEKELSRARDNLDIAQQERLQVQQQLSTAASELDQLRQTTEAVAVETKAPIELKHLPTPMAKTVFGKEIHLRLKAGRLAHVAINDLVTRMKADGKQQLWKLKNSSRVTEVIGPVEGFRMRYTLQRSERTINTDLGPVVQQFAELAYFELIPTADQLGEPLENALRGDSHFSALLAAESTPQTTVTVWVYRDSFEDFRRLKEHLFARGLLTAARPLPDGELISGGPNGSRSSAQ